MKILFVLGFPNPFSGAGWTRIGFFADAWSKKGHLVEVLGAFTYQSLQKRGVKKFVKVNIFNLIFNINLNNPILFALNSIISFVVSTLFLVAKNPQVVIVSVPSGDVGLGAITACKLFRTKYVVDYRDEWEKYTISFTNSRIGKLFYSITKKLATQLYAKCGFVAAVTPNFAASLQRRGVSNVKFMPNGADVTVFSPYNKLSMRKRIGFTESDFIIVYCGGIGEYYRLDVVVSALAKLSESCNKITLLMVGKGPDLPKIISMAKEMSLENNVLHLGVKNNKKELAEILSSVDVGIIPYDDNPLWKNTLPAKFFEYCACGIPVIATAYKDSILAEVIKKYDIGFVVPPMDIKGLAEAIEKVYFNRRDREAAGERARKFVVKEFDRAMIAENFFELLRGYVQKSLLERG